MSAASAERLEHRIVGVNLGEVDGERRRRDDVGDALEFAVGKADVEIGAERSGNLRGKETPQGAAGDAPDYLADLLCRGKPPL